MHREQLFPYSKLRDLFTDGERHLLRLVVQAESPPATRLSLLLDTRSAPVCLLLLSRRLTLLVNPSTSPPDPLWQQRDERPD